MARILVVDDDADLLHLVSTCLSMHEHEVCIAKSKDEFYPLLYSFKPQLIVLDVMLAGTDGRDICKEIKAAEHKHIPVILYSANPKMLENYQDCQADDIIDKPFEVNLLMEKINAMLAAKPPSIALAP